MSSEPLVRSVELILLNGPLGVGKSTLGEVLGEALPQSVMLDGDSLLALNPAPEDEIQTLHAIISLLVRHHVDAGFRRFIIPHYWSSPDEICDLNLRINEVGLEAKIHLFRLHLSKDQNIRRILLRRQSRALDEADFEDAHFAEEFTHLSKAKGIELGIPFDASDKPDVLAKRILHLLNC